MSDRAARHRIRHPRLLLRSGRPPLSRPRGVRSASVAGAPGRGRGADPPGGRCPPRGGRDGNGQDPRVPAPRRGAGPTRRRLHRDQEPPGAARHQGHSPPGPGPRPRLVGGGHEGTRQLPLPPALPFLRRGRQLQEARRDSPLPGRGGVGARDRHGRPGRGHGPPRLGGVLARDLGFERELHRAVLRRFRRVLGDRDAASRPRGRHRGGEPPPLVRRSGREGRQLRRGDSPVRHGDPRRGASPRGHRHSVLRRHRVQPSLRGPLPRRRAGALGREARRPRGAPGGRDAAPPRRSLLPHAGHGPGAEAHSPTG